MATINSKSARVEKGLRDSPLFRPTTPKDYAQALRRYVQMNPKITLFEFAKRIERQRDTIATLLGIDKIPLSEILKLQEKTK